MNFRCRDRMKQLADFAADQPMTGLQRAVWWTEYALRHNDTSHLKAPWASSWFYHEFHLDVVAVLFVVAVIVFITFVKICKLFVKSLMKFLRSRIVKDSLMRSIHDRFRLCINKTSP